MGLKLHNSLSGKLEDFIPIELRGVKMYVCGPTVYDVPHLGHLRSAYVFDVIRKYLIYSGFKVTFVRNVTDIDDKIIDKARESGMVDLNAETSRISRTYWIMYDEDLRAFGIRPPDMEPRATRCIPEMIRMISALVEDGAAYESCGDVYFSVAQCADYGKLSGQKRDAMLEGVRIDANEKKRDTLDFALWKKAKEGEPAWDSPWGKGRPGWHIECSAMNRECLGEQIDIHGGGRDLIFPHHENEIAQSEAFTGKKPFARYWMHHGLVTAEGRKMSKSLKNFVTLEEVRKQPFGIETLKLLFLSTHYGAALDYSEANMKMQQAAWRRFVYFFEEMKQLKKHRPKADKKLGELDLAFCAAMDNDFNTPQALAVMYETMHHARKASDASVQLAAAAKLKNWDHVFGLFTGLDAYFEANAEKRDALAEEMGRVIRERKHAKKTGDFQTADAIRERLKRKGIDLTDRADGTTTWRQTE